MKPPDDEFRAYVATRAFEITEPDGNQADAEAELAELLDEVLARVEAAGLDDRPEAQNETESSPPCRLGYR